MLLGWLLWGLLALAVAYVIMMVLPAKEKNGGSIDLYFSSDDGTTPDRKEVQDDAYAVNYEEPGKRILVAFATEYGFSETLAKRLVDRIRALDKSLQLQPRLLNLRDADSLDWAREELALFVCSTTGDGVPPADAKPFFDSLSTTQTSWNHLHFSVLALGDSSYTHFCRTGILLNTAALDACATAIAPFTKVDQEDWAVIDRWMDRVTKAIPELELSLSTDYLDVAGLRLASMGPGRTNPFMALMDKRVTLSRDHPGEEPRTLFHAEFDLSGSGLSYTAGDALGVYPENNPPEVLRLIKAMDASADMPVELPQSFAFYKDRFVGDKVELRDVLKLAFDLKTVKPELLQTLATKVSRAEHVQTLNQILADGLSLASNKRLADYVRSREVADVLFEFSPCCLPLETILGCLRPLQPRYYSISSAPSADGARCSATVAVVEYSMLGLPRTGVCSTYLAQRASIGSRVPVFVSRNAHFRLPASPAVPIIMIGPGTGIAPFRAFLQERAHATGQNVLYFGCRRRESDFLYADELQAMERNKKLTLRVAFSREHAHKVYVQDLLLQDGSMVWRLLQGGAHVYVCGDASRMAGDVHNALLAILAKEADMDEAQARGYMNELEAAHRYQRDVWV